MFWPSHLLVDIDDCWFNYLYSWLKSNDLIIYLKEKLTADEIFLSWLI